MNIFLWKRWTSKSCSLLPSKLTLEKPLKQEENTDLKSRQQNCQKHFRYLKALASCRISRKDKTEGLCCVWSRGRAEGAEGECEECSVLLLPLQQMFTLQQHSGRTIIGYTLTSGADSHQSPQSNNRVVRRPYWVGTLMKQIMVASDPWPCVSPPPNFHSYRAGSCTFRCWIIFRG